METKEKEIWKTINDYPNYQVSNLGRVKSLNYNNTGKEKILKHSKDGSGYLKVNICKYGKVKTMKVHRLVADAFVQNNSLFNNEVNHIDENTSNNCAWNLEWCDRKYNCNFGTRNERVAKSLSKLLTGVYNTKKSKPVICKETGDIYPSAIEVQRQLGFNQSHISKCCNGKRNTCGGYHWKYVY